MYKKRNKFIWLLLTYFIVIGLLPVYGQFRIEEGFYKSTVNPEVVLVPGKGIHESDAAYNARLESDRRKMLTSGLPPSEKGDVEGDGWLRLTNDVGGKSSAVFIDVPFPSSEGVLVDFEYKTWRQSEGSDSPPAGYAKRGGDGFSVFLFDGVTQRNLFRAGDTGQYLGYSASDLPNRVPNGYLGLGMDEYGNYVAEGGVGGLMSGFNDGGNSEIYERERYKYANSVGLRGKVNPDAKLIASKTLGYNSSTPIGYQTLVAQRPDDDVFYRRVQMELYKDPLGSGYKVDVRWMTSKGGSFTLLFSTVYNQAPPSTLKVGIGGSTGSAVNYHELRNFRVVPPGGVIVDKSVSKSVATVGDELEYTIKVSNLSAGVYSNFSINDDLTSIASFFQVESIVFNGFGKGTSNLSTGAKTIDNVRIDNLQLHSTVIFTVKGKVIKVPPGIGELINVAKLNIDNLPILNKEKETLKLSDEVKTKILRSGLIISNRNIYNKSK